MPRVIDVGLSFFCRLLAPLEIELEVEVEPLTVAVPGTSVTVEGSPVNLFDH